MTSKQQKKQQKEEDTKKKKPTNLKSFFKIKKVPAKAADDGLEDVSKGLSMAGEKAKVPNGQSVSPRRSPRKKNNSSGTKRKRDDNDDGGDDDSGADRIKLDEDTKKVEKSPKRQRTRRKRSSSGSVGKEISTESSPSQSKTSLKKDSHVLTTSSSPSKSSTTPIVDLWVEKYKPSGVDNLVGNISQVHSLKQWLQDWTDNRLKKQSSESSDSAASAKNKSAKRQKIDDEAKKKKAVLISGAPGIGKTSAARVVCQEVGYDIIEMNASDTRNKKSIQEGISELINNRSLLGFWDKNQSHKRVCLIMDEVDGMSSGDRGGVTELIKLVKETKIPIICICNDRMKQSLKTLITYCLELRFQKPRIDSVLKRLKTICTNEAINIEEGALKNLVESQNNDIRSILNNLQLLAVSEDSKKIKFSTTKENNTSKSVSQNNIFDLVASSFSTGDIKQSTDLYFFDEVLAPEFVQHNYLNYEPHSGDRMQCISKAAESISMGDIFGIKIRRDQQWGLAPSRALQSVCYPCHIMRGKYRRLRGNDYMISFPSDLGKARTVSTNNSIVSAIQKSSSSSVTGAVKDILLDYFPVWRDRFIKPLIEKGKDSIDHVIEGMDEYGLTKDDLMSINSMASLSGRIKDVVSFDKIDSGVKRSFTLEFNKSHKTMNKLAYAKSKASGKSVEELSMEGEEEEEEEEEDESKKIDQFVKEVKKKEKQRKFNKKKEKIEKKTTGKNTKEKKPAKPKSTEKKSSQSKAKSIGKLQLKTKK